MPRKPIPAAPRPGVPAPPASRPNLTPPAWSRAELADPHTHRDKPAKVRAMFGAIAGRYDLNNRVHSLWRDQAWRRAAVRAAAPLAGRRVLDAACGTGDLSIAMARAGATEVIGLDFTPEMLDIARRKSGRLGPALGAKLRFVEGDAQELPFADGSFDAVAIAFGIRNVADPARAVREFARVLAPGGRLVVLEFDRPRAGPARWLYDAYCGWLMPRTATLLSGDRSGAYRYLPRSVGSFMTRAELCALLRGCGLSGVRARALTFGICVCYRAIKPARG